MRKGGGDVESGGRGRVPAKPLTDMVREIVVWEGEHP